MPRGPERTKVCAVHLLTAATLPAAPVELDADGFFVHPEQWTDDMAREIACANGVDELTSAHWRVIRVMRAAYLDTGRSPSVRALGRISGVPVRELYRLFPKGPANLAAKIAGVPKPHGCV
jgi:dissimilatory sulfite reductase related protein